MKIKTREISFLPSPSPDVVTNKLYVELTGGVLSYDSMNFDVGNTVEVDGKVHVDLDTYLGTLAEGNYDLGVAAVDDVGNEADMQEMLNVPLDFIAPDPVGVLELV